MKPILLALAALPAAAAAQTLPTPLRVSPAVIAPIDVRPKLVAPAPCMSGIVGEKSSVSGEIVGEKSSVSGEEGRVIVERWSGTGFTTFKHVLVGRPGKRNLSLYGCSSSPGGETVAVYLAGANGERKTGWRHFVIATRNGNHREGTITLPKPRAGQTLSRLPIVVVVENASGRPTVGELKLNLTD